jgi:hypothetical protein
MNHSKSKQTNNTRGGCDRGHCNCHITIGLPPTRYTTTISMSPCLTTNPNQMDISTIGFTCCRWNEKFSLSDIKIHPELPS